MVLENILQNKQDFRTEMAKIFIEEGSYRINYQEAKNNDEIKPFLFASTFDSREHHDSREGEMEVLREELRNSDCINVIDKKISEIVKKGDYLEFYNEGIINPKTSFKKKIIRVRIIRKMVESSNKRPELMSVADFKKNNLAGLIRFYYVGSPYSAFKEAGYDILPWEMRYKPTGLWKEKENRVEAIKWMVERLEKPANEITRKDFKKNNLTGLILTYYKSSPYKALQEAGYDILPWEMKHKSRDVWREKENRVEAIKWMVEKENKPACEINKYDFKKNNLTGLLHYYSGSSYRALKEAGYVKSPLEMKNKPVSF